jgi:hypothetical protein
VYQAQYRNVNEATLGLLGFIQRGESPANTTLIQQLRIFGCAIACNLARIAAKLNN